MEPAVVEAVAPGAWAFRCRNCNTLEESGAAGENATPAACRTCGAGISWSINEGGIPVQARHPENWLVLADLPADELEPILAHHAIGADEIVAHTPFTTTYGRGPDATEQVTHSCPVCVHGIPGVIHTQGQPELTIGSKPIHDCDACKANRPGTRKHVEGATDTVTIPTWVAISAPQEGAPVLSSENLNRTAAEGLSVKDTTR